MGKVWGRSVSLGIVVLTCGCLSLPGESMAGEKSNDDRDWPAWRGPHGNAVSVDTVAVTKWSEDDHVVWQTEVPGRGHSTPIVVGDQVILTTADEDRQEQWVISYDRKTGQERWRYLAHRDGFTRLHRKNSHASASPCSDGEAIYSVFINGNGLHVTTLDMNGGLLWQKKVGDFQSEHGYGSSPVMYKSMLIVNGDNMRQCFLAAIDRRTGKTVWKTDRKTTGRHGSYATPSIESIHGKPQLLLMGMETTTAYHPDTGKQLWQLEGPAEVTACTVASDGKLVFATGGYPEKEVMAIRPGAKAEVVWRASKGVAYVPSPLCANDRLYMVADNGIATCFEASTGRVIWQDRLGGKFSASPVLVGDHLYVPSEAGVMYVISAEDEFRIIARNDLKDGGFASPVVCGGALFVRTDSRLYCLGE